MKIKNITNMDDILAIDNFLHLFCQLHPKIGSPVRQNLHKILSRNFCETCCAHTDDCECEDSKHYYDWDAAYDRWKDDQMERGRE